MRFKLENVKLKGAPLSFLREEKVPVKTLESFFYEYFLKNRNLESFKGGDSLFIDDMIGGIMEAQKIKPSAPLRFGWGLLTECNSKCIHCIAGDALKRKKRTNLNEIEYILQQINELSPITVILTGGEPLLLEYIYTILKKLKENNFVVHLLSNGYTLTERNSERIGDTKVDLVQISLDAADPIIFRKQRGVDCFEKVTEGIKYLVMNGVRVRLNFTATHVNLNQISFVYDLALKIGVSELNFNPVIPLGKGENLISKFDYKKYVYEIIKVYYKHLEIKPSLILTFSLPVEFFYLIYELIPQKDIENFKIEPLIYMYDENTSLSCNEIGDIRPGSSLEDKDFIIGNVYKESLRKIWRKNKVWFRRLHSTKCEFCKFLFFCRGGNPGVTYRVKKTIHAPYPYCPIKW